MRFFFPLIILQLLYKTLELSKDTLMRFNLVTFKPTNIKSHYFFLTRILELLPLLTHLTITKVTLTFHLNSLNFSNPMVIDHPL